MTYAYVPYKPLIQYTIADGFTMMNDRFSTKIYKGRKVVARDDQAGPDDEVHLVPLIGNYGPFSDSYRLNGILAAQATIIPCEQPRLDIPASAWSEILPSLGAGGWPFPTEHHQLPLNRLAVLRDPALGMTACPHIFDTSTCRKVMEELNEITQCDKSRPVVTLQEIFTLAVQNNGFVVYT